MLSGHGYFCKYLFKRWRLKGRNLKAKAGTCIIENFCDVILSSEENWNNMASYFEALRKWDGHLDSFLNIAIRTRY